MLDDLKKVPDTLKEIVEKLGAADKSVLKPYIDQMNSVVEDMKKSGQANIQTHAAKLLDITNQIKDAKVGEIPGLSKVIDAVQSVLKDKAGKTD